MLSGRADVFPPGPALFPGPITQTRAPEAERAAPAMEPERTAGRRADQTGAAPVKTDEVKTDQGGPKPVLREARARGGDPSLLLRQDDADEDNLSSLLTPDYLGQFDIPVVFNDAVQYFVKYFTTERRKIFANWLRRSKRYVPMIKDILREHGLPEDLLYLAMIESGFNPKAYSSMKACGPWQFIYDTGGRYGLRVNHWVDERRDPQKSTVAAALYLKDLFNQFGTWYLAAAAYNAGEKRIEKSIEKHETYDFWELSKYNTLPRETREYIPRLLAAAIVAKDPERFGFFITDYDQPIRFVTEKVPGGTSLTVVAKAASTDMLTVRALNPELLTGITPPDVEDYVIKLPEEIGRDRFREKLETSLEKGRKVQDVWTYVLKRRDSLSRVMKRYMVSYNDLLLVNACDQELRAKPGRVVYIPRFEGRGEPVAPIREVREEAREARPEKGAHKRTIPVKVAARATALKVAARAKPVKVAARAKPVKVATRAAPVKVAARTDTPRSDYHVVKRGESLAAICERYGIDMATLKEINGLKKGQIYPNMRLALTSHVIKSEKPPRTAVYHLVKKGETLSAIAEKYDLDVQTLKEMNRLKRGKVHRGMRLRVGSGRG